MRILVISQPLWERMRSITCSQILKIGVLRRFFLFHIFRNKLHRETSIVSVHAHGRVCSSTLNPTLRCLCARVCQLHCLCFFTCMRMVYRSVVLLENFRLGSAACCKATLFPLMLRALALLNKQGAFDGPQK